MKLMKLPVIAASVALGLMACSDDNGSNAVSNNEEPISMENPAGNDIPGTDNPGNENPGNQNPGNENPGNPTPDSVLSSSSNGIPGGELGGNEFYSSSSAVPGNDNPPNQNPGNDSGDDENDNEDSRTLDGSQILFRLPGGREYSRCRQRRQHRYLPLQRDPEKFQRPYPREKRRQGGSPPRQGHHQRR